MKREGFGGHVGDGGSGFINGGGSGGMTRALLAPALFLALTACPSSGTIDVCKNAAVQRAGYQLAIAAPMVYIRNGQAVPPAVALAAIAGDELLRVLDGNCPVG